MLNSLSLTLENYLVRSRDTIYNWLEDEFIDTYSMIRNDVLGKALSKIHIFYDL